MEEEHAKENLVAAGSSSPIEPEAKKIKIDKSREDDVELIELADDPPAPMTPSTKHRTPKITKEARDAERQRKLEIRRQKEEEKERLRLERERIAEEKRKEKERIEDEKRKEKERKEREREEKRKEEERKKEEKRKADEERQERLRKEEEERQKKKEDREKKRREEEERKELKRKEEEAAEEKKRRTSQYFCKFFKVIDKKDANEPVQENKELWYLPFPIKPGMVLAPIHLRPTLQPDEDILKQCDEVGASTYLSSDAVKKRKIVGCRKIAGGKKSKLFQFHDNYRPPYYGTWRKRDANVKPRRPNCPDSKELEYEVDSDAEWEDEPSDAEECKSDEEDEGPESDEDSESGGFFVDHEYLSDGEGEDSDDEGAAESTEARAQRLAQRASDWKRRVLDRPKLLQPACVGPLYGTALAAAGLGSSPATSTSRAAATLAAHQAVALP